VSFSVFGAIALASIVYRLFGRCSALVALLLWCFSPDILAHAQTIVPDVGATSIGLVASYGFWRYLYTPTTNKAAGAGIGLGLVLLAKLTWLTAVVSLPFTVLFCGAWFHKQLPSKGVIARSREFCIIWLVALFVLNAGYLFEEPFVQLKDYKFCSEALGGLGCNAFKRGNRFQDSWLGELPVPVPTNYLQGIDDLKYEVERKRWSFLMGEWKFGSWPHYYVMTTLF